MALRPPAQFSASNATVFNPLDYEIQAEKAASLARAGDQVETSLRRLRDGEGDRKELVRQAAEAVYAYFIQRELCGFRRHDDVIREYAIPREVLARLGAS
jgi:hypothetical protein